MKRFAKWAGASLLVLVLLVGAGLALAHEPRPDGREGPAAQALAARVEAAVDVDAWARTGAVRWTFAGRNEHLWDRERDLSRVAFGDVVVLQRLDRSAALVTRGGAVVQGGEASELADQAYAAFINDSFWLNPLAKLRDDGVTLSVVDLEGGAEGLLVSYASGGLTPGDAYLWRVGDDGLPSAWQMWVSILPIGGVEVGWGGWVELSTGARVSTRHETAIGVTLELTDVEGAATIYDLIGERDPFDPLGG